MGWLVLLIKNLIVWLDKQSERSILHALPDLGNLLFDPQQALRGRSIRIGPARKKGTTAFLFLVITLISWLALALVFVFVLDSRKAPPGQPDPMPMLFLILWIGLAMAGMLLVRRWLRGGEMLLREEGVELRYRGTEVFCPWSLLYTPGQPFSPGRDQVVLPVVAGAVAQVQAHRHGQLVAEGLRVQTRQLMFRSASEAEIRAFYEVNGVELGKVLLHLGRILGRGAPLAAGSFDFPLVETAETEPAQLAANGRLTVRLTRLIFPAVCCQCGAATTGRQKFRAVEPWFRLNRLWHPLRNDSVHVWVPICYPCQTANKNEMERGVYTGIGMAAVAIILAAWFLWICPNHLGLVLWFLSTVLLAPVLGTVIGYRLGKRQAQPLELGGYSPGRGTIAIRFRRTEYMEQLVQSLSASK